MTEFDKWSKKEYYTYDALCRTDTMRLAWKAALEWALTNKKPIKYKDYKFDYIKTGVIEEELKETEK